MAIGLRFSIWLHTRIILTHAALLIHTGYSGVYCMLMLMVFGMYSQPRAKEGKKIAFTIL